MASAIYRAFKTYKEEHDVVDQLHVPEPPLPTTTKPEPKTQKPTEQKKVDPGQTETAQTEKTANTKALPVFKIQLMSSSKQIEIAPQNFNELTDIGFYKEKNIYKYTFGNFKTIEEAKQALPIVRSKGYKDAFVVAFLNDQRIDPIEASKIKP
jgi:N-acetylmuramoyl-L-alanine amidase